MDLIVVILLQVLFNNLNQFQFQNNQLLPSLNNHLQLILFIHTNQSPCIHMSLKYLLQVAMFLNNLQVEVRLDLNQLILKNPSHKNPNHKNLNHNNQLSLRQLHDQFDQQPHLHLKHTQLDQLLLLHLKHTLLDHQLFQHIQQIQKLVLILVFNLHHPNLKYHNNLELRIHNNLELRIHSNLELLIHNNQELRIHNLDRVNHNSLDLEHLNNQDLEHLNNLEYHNMDNIQLDTLHSLLCHIQFQWLAYLVVVHAITCNLKLITPQ
uniref:CSON001555 protein n=1 Tax=Culicoides sonorensis TaxID=179676 RepID=A0A336K9P1_CULSO